jgi:hypothetical protein
MLPPDNRQRFFEQWFERCLLGEIPKGPTVIMDNAKFHSKKKLRKLARGKVDYCLYRLINLTVIK